MPSKLQYFQSVADQAAQDVAASRSNWTDFLDTSARLYKYTFPDQLLIHNQRPDAIACAPIETWNETFKRAGYREFGHTTTLTLKEDNE